MNTEHSPDDLCSHIGPTSARLHSIMQRFASNRAHGEWFDFGRQDAVREAQAADKPLASAGVIA